MQARQQEVGSSLDTGMKQFSPEASPKPSQRIYARPPGREPTVLDRWGMGAHRGHKVHKRIPGLEDV